MSRQRSKPKAKPKRTPSIPYTTITAAAGKHADAVMDAMPSGKRSIMEMGRQRDHWAVAFASFKRGALFAYRIKGDRR